MSMPKRGEFSLGVSLYLVDTIETIAPKSYTIHIQTTEGKV